MDKRELAAVLAALRFWQANRGGPSTRDFSDIETDFGQHERLSDAEIDTLCERLNAADPAGDRARLAHEVYRAAIEATDSFESQSVGVDIAYLLGAITNPAGDGIVDWSDDPRLSPFANKPLALLVILRARFPAGHPVWRHVFLPQVACRLCGKPPPRRGLGRRRVLLGRAAEGVGVTGNRGRRAHDAKRFPSRPC